MTGLAFGSNADDADYADGLYGPYSSAASFGVTVMRMIRVRARPSELEADLAQEGGDDFWQSALHSLLKREARLFAAAKLLPGELPKATENDAMLTGG